MNKVPEFTELIYQHTKNSVNASLVVIQDKLLSDNANQNPQLMATQFDIAAKQAIRKLIMDLKQIC